MIPLSPNSGLIGWVPHCDTIHTLIRDYRDKKKIMLNIEHRLMLQVGAVNTYMGVVNVLEGVVNVWVGVVNVWVSVVNVWEGVVSIWMWCGCIWVVIQGRMKESCSSNGYFHSEFY